MSAARGDLSVALGGRWGVVARFTLESGLKLAVALLLGSPAPLDAFLFFDSIKGQVVDYAVLVIGNASVVWC